MSLTHSQAGISRRRQRSPLLACLLASVRRAAAGLLHQINRPSHSVDRLDRQDPFRFSFWQSASQHFKLQPTWLAHVRPSYRTTRISLFLNLQKMACFVTPFRLSSSIPLADKGGVKRRQAAGEERRPFVSW